MKKLSLLASLLAATMPALGQGYVNFSSLIAPGTARVTNYFDCPLNPCLLSGPGYQAMLYIGPAGTWNSGALTTNGVQGASAPFLTGAQAGFFAGGRRTITGFNAGDVITAQVRVWSSSFPNWESAPASQRVKSNLIQVQLDNSASGANLAGLQFISPFGVYWAPPSCGALSNASVQVGNAVTLVPYGTHQPHPSWPFCSEGPIIDFTWIRNGVAISYAPTLTITNAQLSDAGTYTVRIESNDGWQDISATVTVTVPPVRLNSPIYTNGGFQFTLTGQAGSNYVIQSSSDLAASNWISRVTNTAPFTFMDTNLGSGPQQFYRAVTP